MNAQVKRTLLVGIILFATAIILGAFGAHGLKEKVSPERIASFEVGVRYQFYIALGMMLVSLLADKLDFSIKSFFWLNLLGVLFFSFSIYGLALQDIFHANWKFLGPITPLGGSLLIIGWILLLIQIWKKA